MAEKSLNDLFAEQRASVIEWGGAPLWGVYDLPTDRVSVTIRF
jgi:hypothetical protein